MIVDIKIYNKVIYNLHVLDSLFLSPLSNCLLKVMIIVSPLIIMIPVSLTSLWSVEFDDELVESPKDRHLMFTFYSDTG